MQKILFEKTLRLFGQEISCTVTELDRGIHVLLTGGDCGHIGAVSIAQPGLQAETMVIPDHKEALITAPWSEKIAEKSGTVCCVVCGIHYDAAAKTQILEIMRQTEALLQEVLSRI